MGTKSSFLSNVVSYRAWLFSGCACVHARTRALHMDIGTGWIEMGKIYNEEAQHSERTEKSEMVAIRPVSGRNLVNFWRVNKSTFSRSGSRASLWG